MRALPEASRPHLDLKVGRDYAVSIASALYSVPHAYRDRTLRVRFDRNTVKLYDRGAVVKVHPRAAAGASVIDPADLPEVLGELAWSLVRGRRPPRWGAGGPEFVAGGGPLRVGLDCPGRPN